MKKIITTFLFIFTSTILFAQQQSGCNFVPTASMLSTTNYSNRNNTIIDNGEKYVFNVKFHAIYGDNAENPNNVNEEFFLKTIADLNILFNPSKIYFKYRGFNSINDTYFLTYTGSIQFSDVKNRFIAESKYDDAAIHIFIRRMNISVPREGGVDFAIPDIVSNLSYPITTQNTTKNYLAHTMGHFLGLLHTHDGTWPNSNGNDRLTTNLPPCIANNNQISNRYISFPTLFDFDYDGGNSVSYLRKSENVTREPLNLDYNADEAGDRVTDTEACFGLFLQNICPVVNPGDIINFTPDQRVKDKKLHVYVNLDNLFYNVMNISSFTYLSTNNFTQGQRTRMRETLLADAAGLYSQRLNKLADGTANVSVLYQPFQSSKTITSIASITDNGNGTATVCRNYLSSNYKFQPGFDYEFPDNQTPDLNSYDTSQTPLVSSPGFNCPVKILQISNDIGNAYTVCRGQVCKDEPYRAGLLYATKVLGSTNITVEELDAIEVKDPNLYNNLMSQYYYIIKKETDSGAKLQEVFYKQ
jgi:hypothetical protein